MISKKMATILLTMTIAISVWSEIYIGEAKAEGGSFGGGKGTLSDPYIIEDVSDLQAMRDDLTAHYILKNDINASATRTWNSGLGFAPVGTYVAYNPSAGFSGSLDGKNYTIKGLFINRPTADSIGLIGSVSPRGSVKNLCLSDCKIVGRNYVGGIVGYNQAGTIDNCNATGNISGNGSNIGGLIGDNHDGTISNCSSTGVVTGKGNVGGLNGANIFGEIFNCRSSCKVSGTASVGGLVGYNIYKVYNSHASGNVSGSNCLGGFVGYNRYKVDSCSAAGNVTGSSGSVGGFVGCNEGGTVTNSSSSGNVSGSGDYLAGFVGHNNDGTISNSHYNVDDVFVNGTLQVTIGGLFKDQYQDWYSNDLSLDISDYSSSLVPSGRYYNIDSVQGLRDLLGFSDAAGYSFRLTGNIDLSKDPGLYIPYLKVAEFDGCNNTVSNLFLNMSNDRIGLFGYNAGSSIKNIELIDHYVNGNKFVGGIVGINSKGAVENCRASGNVSGNGDYVGGIIGVNNGGFVSNCYTSGNVSGIGYFVGGIIGANFGGNVTGSWVSGNVSGMKSEVGGIIGVNQQGTLSRSIFEGNVNGINNNVGGLVGYNYDKSSVNMCHSTGIVSGYISVGGIVGGNFDGAVRNCYSWGTSSGTGYRVGGLVGDNYRGTVSNSYSVGRVTGVGSVGGLVGDNKDGTVSNSFWDTQTSGQTGSAGGTGKTTKEMMTKKTFTDAGWDFSGIWCMVENITYPFFRWQDTEEPLAEAGENQTVYLDENGEVKIKLNGSESSDDIGLVCTWSFNHNDSNVILYGEEVEFTFEIHGVYIITLNVTDAVGNWDIDNITITVIDIIPPVAEAGPDQIIDEGTLAKFDGSGSSDNEGVYNWSWAFTDKIPITLYGIWSTYRFENPGVFVVTLNVTDPTGNQHCDDMTVTVLDITPPSANAGPDQTFDEGTNVAFDGSGSLDNVDIVNYSWTFVYGVQDIVLYGESTSFTFEIPGVYTITLKVTDSEGNWDEDILNLTINDITAPVADAGSDWTITEDDEVTLDGRGSSDNVCILNWTWTFFDLVHVILYGMEPQYRFNNPGTFLISLNVTDASGNWHTDHVNVTVLDITHPVADAGPDLSVNEGTFVSFNGNGSYDNYLIINYTWSFIYGMDEIFLYGVSPSFYFEKPGFYIVRLWVYDAADFLDLDSMNLTVRDITKPNADAGEDMSVPVGSYVLLNGSLSSDNDGFPIGGFNWTFIYNGQEWTLEGLAVDFTFDIAGAYEIVLNVMDLSGNIDQDMIVITVIETGMVGGTVLADDGTPVEGALIEITASNGEIYTATTGSNGSFFIEVHHGDFTWKISREGYETIAGTSSVDPMKSTQLNLPDKPLERISNNGSDSEKTVLPYILGIVGLVVILVTIIFFFILRRKKEEDKQSTRQDEDLLKKSAEIEYPVEEQEDFIYENTSNDLATDELTIHETTMGPVPQNVEEPSLVENTQPEDIITQQTDVPKEEELTGLTPPSNEPAIDDSTDREIIETQS